MRELHFSTFDPEFDSPRQRAEHVDYGRSFEKRLLVNPFLVVLVWLAALAFLRAGWARADIVPFEIGAVLLLLSPLFAQYHCVDCGATGWLIRQRRHTCTDDVILCHRRRRIRVPGVRIQLVVWCYLLAAAAVLLLIWLRT